MRPYSHIPFAFANTLHKLLGVELLARLSDFNFDFNFLHPRVNVDAAIQPDSPN
jgi:hypothetical protein